MGKCNCECSLGCIGISVVASLIIGIVAAFLTFSAVITLAPAFLWAALGTAVVFLALLLGYGLFTGATGSSDCECPIIRTVIVGILGAILTSLVLLGITFAATSVIGAIIAGLLIAFLALIFLAVSCLILCKAGCGDCENDR